MTYLVGTGHNNTAGYGTPDPQPKCKGLRWGRRTLAGNGLEYVDGYPSTEWTWGYLTATQLAALNVQFGLGEGTPSAMATIRTTDRTSRDYSDWNCTILAPEFGDAADHEFTVYHDVTFRMIRMSEI